MTLVIASALPAAQIAALVRASTAKINPDEPVASVQPMTSIVSEAMTQQRFTSGLLGTFALLATVLAVVGVYGVMSLFVSQRRREFGIRLALGARGADVLRLVLRQAALVVAAGAVIGVAGALAASRLLSGVLFGIAANDPVTYAMGVVVLAAVGMAASLIPARRAVTVDPLLSLRSE